MEILNIYLEEQLLIKDCMKKHLVLLKILHYKGVASMVYKSFDEKTSATHARSETLATQNKFAGSGIKNKNISNKELPEELLKPVIRKFKKIKLRSPFIDKFLGAVLSDTQLISKFNNGIRFLLSVIDIFSKYAWVIPLIDKKRHYNY